MKAVLVRQFTVRPSITRIVVVAVSLLLVLLLAGYLVLNTALGRQADPVRGSPSWSALLTVADQAARQRNTSAVLEKVIGETYEQRIGCPTTYNFIFLQPSGDEISIEVQDTVPPAVTKVDDSSMSTLPPSKEDLARLAAGWTLVRVAPDEVCQKTIAAGEATGYQHGPDIKFYMKTETDLMSRKITSEPRWTAWFEGGPGSIKFVFVSSRTGQIVETMYFDPTPTAPPAR